MKDYLTDEFLMMANNVTGKYSDEEVKLVKKELYKRGINDELITDIVEEEETFMRRLDVAACAEQAWIDKRNEKNREISFNGTDFVCICAILICVGDIIYQIAFFQN